MKQISVVALLLTGALTFINAGFINVADPAAVINNDPVVSQTLIPTAISEKDTIVTERKENTNTKEAFDGVGGTPYHFTKNSATYSASTIDAGGGAAGGEAGKNIMFSGSIPDAYYYSIGGQTGTATGSLNYLKIGGYEFSYDPFGRKFRVITAPNTSSWVSLSKRYFLAAGDCVFAQCSYQGAVDIAISDTTLTIKGVTAYGAGGGVGAISYYGKFKMDPNTGKWSTITAPTQAKWYGTAWISQTPFYQVRDGKLCTAGGTVCLNSVAQ